MIGRILFLGLCLAALLGPIACTGLAKPVPTVGPLRPSATPLAPAPSLAPAPTTSPAPLTLVDSDNGRTISVAPGTEISLTLTANATTGYSWALLRTPDPTILAFSGPAQGVYLVPSPAPGLVGAGGNTNWILRAIGTGTTTLRLGYQRPWESGVAPVSSFSVTITVS